MWLSVTWHLLFSQTSGREQKGTGILRVVSGLYTQGEAHQYQHHYSIRVGFTPLNSHLPHVELFIGQSVHVLCLLPLCLMAGSRRLAQPVSKSQGVVYVCLCLCLFVCFSPTSMQLWIFLCFCCFNTTLLPESLLSMNVFFFCWCVWYEAHHSLSHIYLCVY